MWTILKRLSGGVLQKPRGTLQIESTQIRQFSLQSGGRLDLVRGGPKALKTKLAQGGPSSLSPLRSDGSHDGQTGGWVS